MSFGDDRIEKLKKKKIMELSLISCYKKFKKEAKV